MKLSWRIVALTFGGALATIAVACGGADASDPPARQPASAAAAPAVPPPPPAAPSPTPSPLPVAPSPSATPSPPATADEGAGAFAWEIEDIDAGTKPALALTSDNVPHVAYMQEAQMGFVKNATLSDGEWSIDTVAEGYFYGPLDIAIGADDVPRIAYHDHQASTFEQDKGDAAYAVLRGGEWEVGAAFDEGHDGWDNRLTIDSNGKPHMSAVDPEEFDGDGVEYYHLNAAGEWVVENVGSGPLTYKYATSVAVDGEGNPHITYFDQNDNDLALASKGESGWEIAKVDTEGDTGLFASLLIDDTGRFHISYFQKSSETAGVFKYATRAADESEWDITEIDSLDRLSFGFVGARNITSVAVDSTGSPWVAYSDEKTLKLALWNGAEWEKETVVDAGLQTLGQLVSLKIDSDDHPNIAYFIVTNKGPLEGRIKYAKGTPK